MLKLKSKSIMMNETGGEELKQHLSKVLQKQEEQMREKLQRQMDKEARVQALEKDFLQWADVKQNKIKQKLSKSSKNKEDHLNKIVKKCKDHDKYIGQKYKNFKTKKKTEMKDAWKKAEQFNNSIEDYHISKQISHERPSHKERTEQNLTESRFLAKRASSYQKNSSHEYIPAQYNNPSKHASKHYDNKSREYWTDMNNSMKHIKASEPLPRPEDEPRAKSPLNSKLKETLARFQNYNNHHQTEKIQQLGERLQKIEKTRVKRIELHKKKRHQREEPLETEYVQRRQKKKVDRSQRLHSETMIRERRVHDWSQSTKQRREEYLQTQIQAGNDYLEQQKIKYMKTNLAKKIAVSAIEKRLYIQRLNH